MPADSDDDSEDDDMENGEGGDGGDDEDLTNRPITYEVMIVMSCQWCVNVIVNM